MHELAVGVSVDDGLPFPFQGQHWEQGNLQHSMWRWFSLDTQTQECVKRELEKLFEQHLESSGMQIDTNDRDTLWESFGSTVFKDTTETIQRDRNKRAYVFTPIVSPQELGDAQSRDEAEALIGHVTSEREDANNNSVTASLETLKRNLGNTI